MARALRALGSGRVIEQWGGANGDLWFIRFDDGFCIQGGVGRSNQWTQLPRPFKNTGYSIVVTIENNFTESWVEGKTVSAFRASGYQDNTGAYPVSAPMSWVAHGFLDNGV